MWLSKGKATNVNRLVSVKSALVIKSLRGWGYLVYNANVLTLAWTSFTNFDFQETLRFYRMKKTT